MTGIAAIDLFGEPGDLSADVQRGEAAVQIALQQAPRLIDETADVIEFLQVDVIVIQSLGLQLLDVDLVKDRVEEPGLAIELRGEIVEDRWHDLGILAVYHDGHVVRLAELLRVFCPAAVALAGRIEQVGAAGAKAQAELCAREGEGNQKCGDYNDGNGESSHKHC